jgi:hypothetical protein
MAFMQKSFAEVRTQKACTTCNQYPFGKLSHEYLLFKAFKPLKTL